METKYGTIPTSTIDSNVTDVVSHAKQRMKSGLGSRRAWKEMVSFSLPESFPESISRIQTNVSYFHTNYAIVILFVLFLSLLWHPVSLIFFMVMMVAWLFLYFLRDDPIIIVGYIVDERVVSAFLSIVTVVALLLTRTGIVVAGLAIGTVVVLLHGVLRRTDDLVFDEEEGDVVGARIDLKETASSFS